MVRDWTGSMAAGSHDLHTNNQRELTWTQYMEGWLQDDFWIFTLNIIKSKLCEKKH